MNFIKLFLCAGLLFITGEVFCQSSATLKRQKQAINKEIESLKRTRNKIDKSKKISIAQINLLDTQIHLREEKISTINSEIKLLDAKIYDNTSEVHSLQNQLSQLKIEYGKMVQFAFRNQGSYNKLMFVFASRDFNQAYMRLKYLQQFGDSRKKKVTYIKNTETDLNKQISKLDQNKKEKRSLLNDELSEKKSLGNDKDDQSEVLLSLSKQDNSLKKQLDKKQREARNLNNAIQAAIRKEILAEQRRAIEAARLAVLKAKAVEAARLKAENLRIAKAKAAAENARTENIKSANNKLENARLENARIANAKAEETNALNAKAENARINELSKADLKPVSKGASILAASPEAARLSSDFLGNRGRLPRPVEGIVTQNFGAYTYKNVTVNNTGINIKTAEGASVYAIFGGQVVNVVYLVNSYTVIIRHGEYFSIYSKLRNTSVSKGQKVSTKQLLGTVATDRSEDITELQFQIWKGANPINPSGWITR